MKYIKLVLFSTFLLLTGLNSFVSGQTPEEKDYSSNLKKYHSKRGERCFQCSNYAPNSYSVLVLLVDSGDKITIGSPLVKGSVVSAKILSHLKGDKVIVFKKKRRKGYEKKNGHRQYFTKILIENISI